MMSDNPDIQPLIMEALLRRWAMIILQSLTTWRVTSSLQAIWVGIPPPRTWLPRSGIRPGRPASAPSPAWSGVRCGCRLTRRLRLFSFFLLAPMEAASDTSFRHIFFKIYCGWSDAIHSKKRSTMVTQMKQTPWTMQMNEKAKKRRVAYRPRSRASRRTHSVTTDHGSPSAWTGVAVTSSWSIGCTRGVC